MAASAHTLVETGERAAQEHPAMGIADGVTDGSGQGAHLLRYEIRKTSTGPVTAITRGQGAQDSRSVSWHTR